jgi:hypothetical protein
MQVTSRGFSVEEPYERRGSQPRALFPHYIRCPCSQRCLSAGTIKSDDLDSYLASAALEIILVVILAGDCGGLMK